ncbi:MAG: signal peptidase II [Coxiellaceae bacterium]|nr:signal peptidase II [Coxiellaceae bacterium]
MASKKTSLYWLGLSVIIIILDQWTKWLSVQHLPFNPKRLLPVFNLSLAYNRGSAFGFLNQASGWQVYAFAVIAVIVIIALFVWLIKTPSIMRLRACGIALILGGAIGNLIDRVRLKYVVDFIQLHYGDWFFPTFNLADTAVTLGAICLIISLLIDE